jgi:type VI secretion system secreted protein VgrG
MTFGAGSPQGPGQRCPEPIPPSTATVPFTLTTPLPAGDLVFASISHNSRLSTLEQAELALTSNRADIDPNKLLGKPMSLAIELRGGTKRHVHGYVTRFGAGMHKGRQFGWQATLRPWLWFLTRTNDCRIFQDMTAPEIVEAVFKDHAAIADYELKLVKSYRKRVYCVQYRESDFNFVARLMEDEGIYWYFEHSDGGHKLILVDDASSHDPVEGPASLPHYDNAGQAPPDSDYVTHWRFAQEVQSGKTVLSSYDFERPTASLLAETEHPRQHEQAELEVFDWQGDYVQRADGQHLTDTRIDEAQCRFHRCTAGSNSHTLATGRTFALDRHTRDDQNQKYLLTEVQVSAFDAGGESGGEAGAVKCSFTAQPASQQFRPPRQTPRPFVQGPQTAVVTGPSGEEIYTDKYGRVKVHFHWDRNGDTKEKSSCFVRVSSPWAGKSFGMVHIPRIGQEVVVSFLEGDPDQPLITGRVYNADNMPPWELPANATQSGILTRSSKGGAYGNANAIRFEDKKGSEQLWIHAEKNQDIEVENDETHWVGHDRTKTVDHDEKVHVKHDRIERVDNNESISIGVDRTMQIGRNKTEQVGANKIVDVGANHSETIGAAMSLVVGSTLTETVAVNHAETVGGAMEITVGAAMAITVGAAMSEAVGGSKSEAIGASLSTSAGRDVSLDVGKNLTEAVGENRKLSVKKDNSESIEGKHDLAVKKEATVKAKKVLISADDEITFKTGSAEIVMKKNGDITIKGGKINIKGSGDVTIKGSKVAQN